ncbi:response regulator [Tunicatimonas pelagia]|uniref:response regulator n=1 Tax=Tunicatimonas pelagia TaxID=931531 RepID=UPI0026670518|nr:response regulator [Tunicatimonas pelagia]WKN45487.1 response regulator [Tunicatimonas pelagia]
MKKILYVEDDRINAFVLTKLLEDQFEIVVVVDGEKCLNQIQKQQYDLILMDINLGQGKMDGVQTMQKLKEMPAYQSTPVFAVTSYANPGDREKFLHQGFDAYFSKPVDKARIVEAITNYD